MQTEIIEKDIRGQICPSSLLLALREINRNFDRLANGVLEIVVLTDNRDATGTIPTTVENMGLHSEVEKIAGYYRILVKK
ncbi:MAG TPA: sulfurtransferase TusA family protein [Desulfuromonadales bacterium]|nr:sulfurtransferase TusA family protein [Desulfuromonadales bacterium]